MKTLRQVSKIKLLNRMDYQSKSDQDAFFAKAGACPDYEGMCSRPQPVQYPCCLNPTGGGKPVY